MYLKNVSPSHGYPFTEHTGRSCATEQELECFCTLRNICMCSADSRKIPDNTEISLPDSKLAILNLLMCEKHSPPFSASSLPQLLETLPHPQRKNPLFSAEHCPVTATYNTAVRGGQYDYTEHYGTLAFLWTSTSLRPSTKCYIYSANKERGW